MAASDWIRVSRSQPCPICGGLDQCGISKNGEVASCVRQEFWHGKKAFKSSTSGIRTAHLHRLVETAPGGQVATKRGPVAREPVPDQDPAQVYERLVTISPIDLESRRECERRKIDPGAALYGAFPAAGRRQILGRLIEEFGRGLLAVPGFVETSPGIIDFSHRGFVRPALLVPCRDRQGRIGCLRIRNPRPDIKKGKWVYLGGGRNFDDTPGATAKPTCHWARVPERGAAVLVTEGERKADTIAAHWPGPGVVSVPGVAAWRACGLIEDLEALEASTVVIAFDADLWSNIDVARGLLGMAAALTERGVAVEVLVWDPAHKGLDDALLAGIRPVVRSGDEADQFRADLSRRHGLTMDGAPLDTTAPSAARPMLSLDTESAELVDRAVEAIAARQDLFWRHGGLIYLAAAAQTLDPTTGKERPSEIRFAPITPPGCAVKLDQSLRFVRQTKTGIAAAGCPLYLAQRTLATIGEMGRPKPRSLFGLIHGPTLDLSGDLINSDGYHRLGGLGWWQAGSIPGLDAKLAEPGADPREFAFAQVESLRGKGFPYIDWADPDEDWPRFLAFLFALILRPLLPKVPFHLVSGNAPGTGKGALVSAAHRIAYGHLQRSQLWPERSDNRDEVLAKELVNAIEAGQAVVYFDDIPAGTQIASKVLDAMIGGQGAGVSVRVMHQNQGAEAGGPARLVIFGCGNNVAPNEDFGRRCVTIRLEARSDSPATRDPKTAFKGQGDLGQWMAVDANREACLIHALNALRAYLRHLAAGGAEMPVKSLGGFVDYARLCAGAVMFATGTDPLARMSEEIRSTESAGGLAALLGVLADYGILGEHSRRSTLIKEEIMKLEHEKSEDITSLFFACGARGKELTSRSIGKILAANKNKRIRFGNDLFCINASQDRDGFQTFSLKKDMAGAADEKQSPQSPQSPHQSPHT